MSPPVRPPSPGWVKLGAGQGDGVTDVQQVQLEKGPLLTVRGANIVIRPRLSGLGQAAPHPPPPLAAPPRTIPNQWNSYYAPPAPAPIPAPVPVNHSSLGWLPLSSREDGTENITL